MKLGRPPGPARRFIITFDGFNLLFFCAELRDWLDLWREWLEPFSSLSSFCPSAWPSNFSNFLSFLDYVMGDIDLFYLRSAYFDSWASRLSWLSLSGCCMSEGCLVVPWRLMTHYDLILMPFFFYMGVCGRNFRLGGGIFFVLVFLQIKWKLFILYIKILPTKYYLPNLKFCCFLR